MQVNLFIWDALTGFPASYNTLIEGDAVNIFFNIVRLRASIFLIYNTYMFYSSFLGDSLH